MFSSNFQNGNSFKGANGPFSGGPGEQPPLDSSLNQTPFGGEIDFADLNLLEEHGSDDKVIDIGLHFHEKLRKIAK
jgi:hypothetical protein